MAFLGVVILIFARQIMGIFFEHQETVQHGVTLLRIFALGFPFYGAWLMTEMVHTGVGFNTPVMIMSIVHSWGFQVIPALLATQFFGGGELSVWWILNIAGVLSFFSFFTYYKRGRWLTVKV
jgi:Na+-driven multidrug efflux pump